MKGRFGELFATLKRMQWTILEHDPYLSCTHDGRIVDPRRVCPHSMHTLLKKAARAWQWEREALHSSRSSAHLRSVVVDGQWTQRRKYRAAETLSPICALCSSEEGSLIHRHFRCSEVPDGEPSNMLGPFHAAAASGAL